MPHEQRDRTVEQYVGDMAWPANQDQVISHLRGQGAPEEVVRRVQELPKHEFRDRRDLADAFHGSGKWRGSSGREGMSP